MGFESFVTSIPTTCTIAVRVSDNVLDEGDWTVDLVVLTNGIVTGQATAFQGLYRIPDMLGWTVAQVCEWTRHDDTGSHPENYHEVSV